MVAELQTFRELGIISYPLFSYFALHVISLVSCSKRVKFAGKTPNISKHFDQRKVAPNFFSARFHIIGPEKFFNFGNLGKILLTNFTRRSGQDYQDVDAVLSTTGKFWISQNSIMIIGYRTVFIRLLSILSVGICFRLQNALRCNLSQDINFKLLSGEISGNFFLFEVQKLKQRK